MGPKSLSPLPKANPRVQSGKRDSNPRPQPWQGCALPTELFPHTTLGSRLATKTNDSRDVSRGTLPSILSTRRSADHARPICHVSGGEGNRTPDLLNAIQALSQLSYAPSSHSTVVSSSLRLRSSPERPNRNHEV